MLHDSKGILVTNTKIFVEFKLGHPNGEVQRRG